MKKLLCYVLLAGSTAGLFSGCSSDDDNDDYGMDTKKGKFTITVNGIKPGMDLENGEEYDQASFIFAGVSLDQGKPTIWKVNGVERPNEEGITIDEDDFATTKTFTVETVADVVSLGVSVQCINFKTPFTVSYKAEINGKVVKEIKDQSVEEGKDFTVTYDY